MVPPCALRSGARPGSRPGRGPVRQGDEAVWMLCPDTASTRGMIAEVAHLVRITDARATASFDRLLFENIKANLATLEIDEIKRRLAHLLKGYIIESPVFDPAQG